MISRCAQANTLRDSKFHYTKWKNFCFPHFHQRPVKQNLYSLQVQLVSQLRLRRGKPYLCTATDHSTTQTIGHVVLAIFSAHLKRKPSVCRQAVTRICHSPAQRFSEVVRLQHPIVATSKVTVRSPPSLSLHKVYEVEVTYLYSLQTTKTTYRHNIKMLDQPSTDDASSSPSAPAPTDGDSSAVSIPPPALLIPSS